MVQTNSPLAFHGKPAIKVEFIAHLEAELTANNLKLEMWSDLVDLGILEWLVCVGKHYVVHTSPTWSFNFLQAVRVGADLDGIKGPFLVFVLHCALEKVISRYADVVAVVSRSIVLWERSDIHSPGWMNEASAANAAAWAAAGAADARPPWNAARAAARAAEAAVRVQAVAETVHEVSRVAERAGYGYGSDGVADELLRLMRAQ